MSPRVEDRRVRRTRRRLKEALLELIDERDYSRITIRDITDRADIGRSTFYSHFASKEDLLFSGFDGWLHSLTEAASAQVGGGGQDGGRSPRFRFSLPLLRHASSQKRFIQAALVRGSNARIRRRTTVILAEAIRLELDRIAASGEHGSRHTAVSDVDPGPLREAEAHALAGAFLALVSWWLADGRGLSAEAVDGVFQGLFPPESTGPETGESAFGDVAARHSERARRS